MTRAERLAQQEARATARLEAQRQQLAQVQAQRRHAEQKARTARRLQVGRLVDQAGLFVLNDTTLAALFAELARLVDAPNPVATLAGLLCAAEGAPGTSGDGCAEAAPRVGPYGAKLDLAR